MVYLLVSSSLNSAYITMHCLRTRYSFSPLLRSFLDLLPGCPCLGRFGFGMHGFDTYREACPPLFPSPPISPVYNRREQSRSGDALLCVRPSSLSSVERWGESGGERKGAKGTEKISGIRYPACLVREAFLRHLPPYPSTCCSLEKRTDLSISILPRIFLHRYPRPGVQSIGMS